MILTEKVLLVTNPIKKSWAVEDIPMSKNLSERISKDSVSKADDRSRSIIWIFLFLSKDVYISFSIRVIAVSVLWFFLKALCKLQDKLLESIKVVICLKTIFSRILEIKGSWAIGRKFESSFILRLFFFKIGVIIECFKIEGITPVIMDWLMIEEKSGVSVLAKDFITVRGRESEREAEEAVTKIL